MSPMVLLENGIPLSLLLDLILGPESADLLEHEPRVQAIPAQPERTAVS